MMINTNLKAPILLSKYLLSNLSDIININSMIGLEPREKELCTAHQNLVYADFLKV